MSDLGDRSSPGLSESASSELLTGRRASADTPLPNWRADDEFSGEVSLTLRFAVAHPPERFPSISRLHASLKQLVALCPFEMTPADLALFLYDLLNPESQTLPAPFDGNSTNPVPADHRTAAFAKPSAKGFFLLSSSPAAPPAPRELFSASRWAAMHSRFKARWAGRVAAIAAAAIVLLSLWLPGHRVARSPLRTSAGAAVGVSSSSAGSASDTPSRLFIPAESAVPARRLSSGPLGAARSKPRLPREVVPARRLAKDHSAAETLRLRAALARIEAERLDAPAHAAETFLQGRSQEQAGQRLLSRLQYAAARDAYAQALDFFAESEARSREERMRQILIVGASNQ